jgi:methylphosphotriester-DNA--protein-cysteine methyltransferase
MRQYKLIGPDGTPHNSRKPGAFGGYKATRIYGRLDCPSALRAIANGGYVAERVFFADEVTAMAAGYRPCARCLPGPYRAWKASNAAAERSRCR